MLKPISVISHKVVSLHYYIQSANTSPHLVTFIDSNVYIEMNLATDYIPVDNHMWLETTSFIPHFICTKTSTMLKLYSPMICEINPFCRHERTLLISHLKNV